MNDVMPVSPVPQRLRPPSWFDARLVLGVILVLASIAGGAFLVSSSGRTQRVWAMRHDVEAGVVLSGDDLVAVAVRVPSGAALYFAASTSVTGQSVTRRLAAGELLPRSA